MNKPYIPSQKILERYADVLVNFALGGGKGIKKGDTVLVHATESTRLLYIEVLKAVWKKGGNVIQRYGLDDAPDFKPTRTFYELASNEQLAFFPKKLAKGQIETIDHSLMLYAKTDMHALKGIDTKKMHQRNEAWKLDQKWFFEKERAKKLTWSVANYATEAMAKEAGMSLKEYWQQIINACFLDKENPIKEWRKIEATLARTVKKLNDLEIEKVHVVAPDIDLWVQIGEKRGWKSGGGANIPSFEVFTSPDWRGTEGYIKFNQPLYRYGNLVKGIELEFRNGKVVRSKATHNEDVLKTMIATKDADKLGEFSLTDRRLSRITRFMADTMYDENMGGPNGNTHVALGMSYKDCYKGDPSKVKSAEWKRLGYNDSSVHTDMFSTSPRTVTAYLKNGKTKVIYKNGQFTL
ncbi:MAG: aminopeptidase [Parcubacteria group bacterium]|nr:aminopeptidase [Parcubacteria group bacterium]